MKTALKIIMKCVIFAFLPLYLLYFFIFRFPKKMQHDVHKIPIRNHLYKLYRNKMLKCIDEMENTPFESVNIRSEEGFRLHGRMYTFKENAPIVIFFHGYHSSPEWDGFGFFKTCKNNNINILMVDQRVHGKSEGKTITFGIKERNDCRLWIDYVIKHYGKQKSIILAGVSIGASTVLMSALNGLPENVKAIISDCAFTEPSAIIKATIKKFHLPVKPFYFLIKSGAKIFGHFNLEEASAVNAVKQMKIPVLFIHGKADSVVPLSMNDEIYENCKSKKQRILIEKADHANSALTDYETYEKSIMDFLKMVILE